MAVQTQTARHEPRNTTLPTIHLEWFVNILAFFSGKWANLSVHVTCTYTLVSVTGISSIWVRSRLFHHGKDITSIGSDVFWFKCHGINHNCGLLSPSLIRLAELLIIISPADYTHVLLEINVPYMDIPYEGITLMVKKIQRAFS